MAPMLCPRCGNKLTKSGNCFKCGARPLVFNKEVEKFHVVVNNHPIITKDCGKYATVHFNINFKRPFIFYGYSSEKEMNEYNVDTEVYIDPLDKIGNKAFFSIVED